MKRIILAAALALVVSSLDASAQQLTAIRAGQFADIVATPENPLDDISALKRVSFVMKNGKVFKSAK